MPPSVSLSDASTDASAAKPSRRNREELEALAAEFVNSRIHVRPAPPRKVPKPALAAGAAGLVAAVVLMTWGLWPAETEAPVREAAPVVNEAELWAKRLEAERERKRLELQRGREYLEKMAAVDHALMKDMTARAQNLAARAEAAPEPAAAAPTPAPAGTGEPTPKTTPAAATTARPEPAASTPAQAPPQQVANAAATPGPSAPAPKCSIHVSELSSSGKLTYADVARMKGARTDDRGHVFTPPLMAAGRPVVFDVAPDGCVRVVRSAGR